MRARTQGRSRSALPVTLPGHYGCDDFRQGESGLDLLVEFAAMEPHARVDASFGMRDELRTLLGLEVDLVMAGVVKNPSIARDIERARRLLDVA